MSFHDIFEILLNDFKHEQRQLLFGHTENLKDWLKQHNVDVENVRIQSFNYYN